MRNGLWCKWEIAQRHWDEANGRWSQLKEKSQPVHLALRRSIVDGLLKRSSLSAADRDRLEKEKAEFVAATPVRGEDAMWVSHLATDSRGD